MVQKVRLLDAAGLALNPRTEEEARRYAQVSRFRKCVRDGLAERDELDAFRYAERCSIRRVVEELANPSELRVAVLDASVALRAK